MKKYILTLTLMLFSFIFFGFHKASDKIDNKYESTVILNIKKHSSEEIQTAQSLLLKKQYHNYRLPMPCFGHYSV